MAKILTVIASCLTLLAFGAPSAIAAAAPPSADEAAMLSQINEARQARGLTRLRFEGRLERVSRWMSRDMAANNRFDHMDSIGRDPFHRLDHFRYKARSWRGENIAAGNLEVARTYSQWWNSPAHKANMLSTHYRYVGIARVCSDASEYQCYWTTEFGGHWTEGFTS